MKKTIVLLLSLFCLGSIFPIISYQLCNVLASTAAQGSIPNLNLGIGQSSVSPAPTTPDAPTQNAQSSQNGATANKPSETPAASNAATPSPQPLADFWQTGNATADKPTAQPIGTPNGYASLAPLLILDEGSGEVLTVSVRDYLIGAVASELAMTWPDEALKAQAVACHSYILYCKQHTTPDALQGAYLSADPARRQGFMTNEVLRSYWGTAYQANYSRLAALVDEVLDVVVLYDGAVAATSYFAISNTVTETSQAAWGQALPYLTTVDSSADANADGFLQTVTYTAAQTTDILTNSLGLWCDGYAPADYFGEISYTDAGYVRTQTVCGTAVSGSKLRTAFALRSNCFLVSYQTADDTFTFTTAGYGHGVGLSQWGAKFYAEAGSDYAQILAHYFPGTTLGSASNI